MRYTASAAMEDRTLRDVERWKDKIEIRLDNRQVFFLFFGSALVACLLFVLGVVVGKRLESRGRAAAPEIEDPLALLDRIAATPGAPDEAITFPRTLIHSPPVKPEKRPGRRDVAANDAKALAVKAEPAPSAVPPTAAPKPPTAAPARLEAKPSPVTAAAATEPRAQPVPAPAADKAAPAAEKVVQKPADAKPAKLLEKAPADAVEKKGKFALQLGSFQSREEADAFMGKFAAAAPYIVVSDIPDKGRWYRVRVGNFNSGEEALQAKADFERAHRQIAYVAPR